MGPFQSKMESSNFLFNTQTSIWRTQLFFKALAIKHRLVQHVLLLAATHKTFDVIKAKPKFVLYIVGGAELLIIPLYMGPRVLCLSVLTLALHKPPILYCIAQHLDKQQQNLVLHPKFINMVDLIWSLLTCQRSANSKRFIGTKFSSIMEWTKP